MVPAPFQVQREELEDGVRVFTVHGELDMSTVPELEDQLEDALADPSCALMLDLTDCEFVDSTAIALIVRSWQRIDRGAGGDGRGRFVLCCINHQVRRLLKITGVEASIAMHEERAAALAELRA